MDKDILNYCISKYGPDVITYAQDRTVFEVLSHFLDRENGMKLPDFQEDGWNIDIQKRNFDSFRYNLYHFKRVLPREPMAVSSAPIIYGVLLERDGTSRLIDGYHRLKWMLTHSDKRQGEFIIVSK